MLFDFGSGFIPATVCWRGCCPLCTVYWKDISYTFKIENKRKKKSSPKRLKLQLWETAKHTENEIANANHHGILFSCSYCAFAANKENCCSCCGNTSLITHISNFLLAGCMYRCWLSPAPTQLCFRHNWEVKPQNKLLRWTGSSRERTLFHRVSNSNTDHGITKWKPQHLLCGHQELLGCLIPPERGAWAAHVDWHFWHHVGMWTPQSLKQLGGVCWGAALNKLPKWHPWFFGWMYRWMDLILHSAELYDFWDHATQ